MSQTVIGSQSNGPLKCQHGSKIRAGCLLITSCYSQPCHVCLKSISLCHALMLRKYCRRQAKFSNWFANNKKYQENTKSRPYVASPAAQTHQLVSEQDESLPCSLNADSQSVNINDLVSAISDSGWLVAPFTTLNDGKITLLDVGSGHSVCTD